MRKEHVYYVVIALGVLAPVIYIAGASSLAGKLEPPEVLEQKVLHGNSTEERLAAAKGLIQHGASARKEIRRALADSRQNDPVVRACLLQAAMQIQDWRSLPEVFEAMGDPDVEVRGAAAAAAVRISGLNDGFLANDQPEKREKIREKMRLEFEAVKHRYLKFYPDQEE